MENWRDVVGYEGLYKVSDEGRVIKVPTGRVLKTDGHAHGGYHKAELNKDGTVWREYVHRLVLTAFVEPCPLGLVCRHLDGNPSNNHLANLAWGTDRENWEDSVRHGTYKGEPEKPRPAPCMHRGPARRLSQRRFAALEVDLKMGMSLRVAAEKYGVSKTFVVQVRKGRCSHRGEPRVRKGYRAGLRIYRGPLDAQKNTH